MQLYAEEDALFKRFEIWTQGLNVEKKTKDNRK